MEKEESVEQRIEQHLRQGRWGILDRLPAERQLAEEFGVNRGTLRAALHSLAGRGLLETARGSGTVVRAIPDEAGTRAAGTLRQRVEGFRMIMPAVSAVCTTQATPTHVLELERLLPLAGAALHSKDTRDFAQMQLRFFTRLLKTLGNPVVMQAMTRLLPEVRQLTHLLQHCSFAQSETLFSILARILAALRHADAEGARQATDDYAAEILRILEAQA